jgi:copper chaperone CopZ
MAQQFEISGMHCGGCVQRVTKALKAVSDEVTVTLDPPRAVFAAPVDPDAVRAALAKAGDYTATPLPR